MFWFSVSRDFDFLAYTAAPNYLTLEEAGVTRR